MTSFRFITTNDERLLLTLFVQPLCYSSSCCQLSLLVLKHAASLDENLPFFRPGRPVLLHLGRRPPAASARRLEPEHVPGLHRDAALGPEVDQPSRRPLSDQVVPAGAAVPAALINNDHKDDDYYDDHNDNIDDDNDLHSVGCDHPPLRQHRQAQRLPEQHLPQDAVASGEPARAPRTARQAERVEDDGVASLQYLRVGQPARENPSDSRSGF